MMQMLYWFPCWGHLIAAALLLTGKEWGEAWFAATTALFAYFWLSGK